MSNLMVIPRVKGRQWLLKLIPPEIQHGDSCVEEPIQKIVVVEVKGKIAVLEGCSLL